MNTPTINPSKSSKRANRRNQRSTKRMMRKLMRLMRRILRQQQNGGAQRTPQANPNQGLCSCRRPQFGHGMQTQPFGNPVSGFLGQGTPFGSTGNFSAPGQLSSPFGGQLSASSFNPGAANPGDWAGRLPSKMQHLAPHFQAFGSKYNVDPKFLAAISMLETGSGTSSAFRNKQNAMGVSNSSGPISFAHPSQSIERMARVLASSTGPYKGAATIAGIGRIYAPPGAGNDPNGTNGYWATGVSKFYTQLGGNPAAQVLQRA